MKLKRTYNAVLCLVLACVLFTGISMITAVAAPEDETTPPTAEITTEPATDAPTDEPTEPITSPPTDPPTDPPTEEETQAPTDEETDGPTEEETQEKTTEAAAKVTEPSNTLPTLDEHDFLIPGAVGSDAGKSETNVIAGIVSWICVAVGIAVIGGVLLSTKSSERKGSGKHRYGGGNKITGKKRLLSDEYYQNRR